jgi:WD40 repeat protein
MLDDASICDPTKAALVKSFAHDRQLVSSRFSPCGRFVFAGGLDNLIHRWNLESGEHAALAGHSSWITGLVFDAAGGRMVSGDFQGNVKAWPYAADAPAPLWSIQDAQQGILRDVAISPDGKLLATVGSDCRVRLWNTADGTAMRQFEGHKMDVYRCAFHPDGKSLVSGDLLGVVKHWDLANGQHVRDLDASSLHTRGNDFDFIADVGGVRRMVFDRGGTQLACAGLTAASSNSFCAGRQEAVLLDWTTGQSAARLSVNAAADGPMTGIAYLAGDMLAGCGESGAGSTVLCFWKRSETAPFHTLPLATAYDLDLHPDGLRLAVAVYEPRGQGGNGRPAKTKDEYIPNGGSVQIFSLTEPAKGT